MLRIRPTESPGLLTLKHTGESNFIVTTVNSSGKQEELLVNEIGPYKGTVIYSGDGSSKNVAAIQIGFLLDRGALTWDSKARAGNGKDVGALTIHRDKLVPAVSAMMQTVAGIKARGDRAAAEALSKRYVDGDVVPHAVIQERFLRFPKASFVYSLRM